MREHGLCGALRELLALNVFHLYWMRREKRVPVGAGLPPSPVALCPLASLLHL